MNIMKKNYLVILGFLAVSFLGAQKDDITAETNLESLAKYIIHSLQDRENSLSKTIEKSQGNRDEFFSFIVSEIVDYKEQNGIATISTENEGLVAAIENKIKEFIVNKRERKEKNSSSKGNPGGIAFKQAVESTRDDNLPPVDSNEFILSKEEHLRLSIFFNSGIGGAFGLDQDDLLNPSSNDFENNPSKKGYARFKDNFLNAGIVTASYFVVSYSVLSLYNKYNRKKINAFTYSVGPSAIIFGALMTYSYLQA